MKRKEMGCVAVGAILGVAGCSPPVKSMAAPVANAEEAAPEIAGAGSAKNAPHLSEVLLTLISGTTKDMSSALFRLEPHAGWSVASNDSRLEVSIQNEHVAVLQAPEDREVRFIAVATISHVDGFHFTVRCHVEAGCTA